MYNINKIFVCLYLKTKISFNYILILKCRYKHIYLFVFPSSSEVVLRPVLIICDLYIQKFTKPKIVFYCSQRDIS